MRMDQIIIKQSYFDNIKTAVDSINRFFESEFREKNFPVDTSELDWAIANIIELLEDLDPAYVLNNDKLEDTLDMISDEINNENVMSNAQFMSNRPMRNAVESVISYVALTEIANDFDTFNRFVNGIYTFELFMKPSQYRKEIQKFTANLPLPGELEELDIDSSIFDVPTYVMNLNNNPDITFPETMNPDSEVQRILSFRDIQNTEIVVDDKTPPESDTAPATPPANTNQEVQEGAASGAVIGSLIAGPIGAGVGAHIGVKRAKKKEEKKAAEAEALAEKTANKVAERTKQSSQKQIQESYGGTLGAVDGAMWGEILGGGAPGAVVGAAVGGAVGHANDKTTQAKKIPLIRSVRYRASDGKYQISEQTKRFGDSIVKQLESFAPDQSKDLKQYFQTLKIPNTVDIPLPYIITSAMKRNDLGTQKAYNRRTGEMFATPILDLFAKNKDAVIKYIQDYMSLTLINNPTASIQSKKLLSIFNKHDAPTYIVAVLNVRYNASTTKNTGNAKMLVLDYKNIIKRINANSKNATVYEKDTKPKNNTSKAIKESTELRIKEYGDISLEAMQLCEGYKDILFDEISTVQDSAYNNGMSINQLDEFITEESYTFMESIMRPAAKGDIPAYMMSRIDVSAGERPNKPEQDEPTEVPDPLIPPPRNSIEDLSESIDEKMDMPGDLDELIGNKFKPEHKNGNIVYNVTYNNSFNKTSQDSHNTTNDLSENKRVSNTSNTSHSNNTTANSKNTTNSKNPTNTINPANTSETSPKNNNDNSNDSLDTKEFQETAVLSSLDRTLSNGLTIRELFTFLESEEPLSNEFGATAGKPPKEDSLTRALDKDRESLANRQESKRKFQKFGNTVRAKAKGITRTKMWLTNVINSLIERDEEKVKQEIIENPSYRTSLYKALRLGIKLGLTGVAFTISTWLGAAVAVYHVAKASDKARLRREVQDEMVTELKILDEKIEYASKTNNQAELYKLMRIKGKLTGIAADASRGRWVTVQPKRKWY